MRILLTANASYLPPRGGATRSNLVWLEHLAASGDTCRVVASALGDTAEKRGQIVDEQIHLAWSPVPAPEGVEAYRRGALTVCSVAGRARQLAVLRAEIRDFEPDWVLVSSEDIGHVLLRAASQRMPGRVVYIAHTPQFYPFGPASWNPDAEAAALVTRAAGIVAIGRHMADYIYRHSGRRAAVVHPPIYGAGPFPDYSSFDRGLITLINPCAVKGISIFLALADALPHYSFGALEGWGTTAADRAELEKRPNIELLPNCKDIAQVLARTRLLLMPSLWYEGFGLSVMEAMLHSIPVVSSDSGGLMEAKAGTHFVVPVRPIERFESAFDERGMPRPIVQPTDIGPWVEAIETLLGNRTVYEQEAADSRVAALRFASGLRAGDFREFLRSLQPHPAASGAATAMESLSPERRTLLLERLRQARKPG
jgi:glycosyltransferase involved in cell wall biosynthesis